MTKVFVIAALVASVFTSKVIAGNDPFKISPLQKTLERSLASKSRRSSDKLIGIGAQTSILKLLGSDNPTLIGFGVNGLFSLDGEKNAFFADFNYYLPGTKSRESRAYAISSQSQTSGVDITINSKISGMGLRVGFRRYLINDISEDGFKMYFHGAVGLLLFKINTSATDYDHSQYYSNFEESSSASGFTFGGGFGAEYSIDSKINIFVEGNFNIPANTVNGQAVEVEIPLTLQPYLGVRYHF